MAKPPSKKKKPAGRDKVPKGFVKVALEVTETKDRSLVGCVIEAPNGVRIMLSKVDPIFLRQFLAIPGGS